MMNVKKISKIYIQETTKSICGLSSFSNNNAFTIETRYLYRITAVVVIVRNVWSCNIDLKTNNVLLYSYCKAHLKDFWYHYHEPKNF